LGVTFYELLTGQLPFPTIDVLELVHCHIAKHPTPPHELNPNIPRPVSEVVLKLMAKNAEDRYQSPYSLKADLETCLRQWQTMGRIEPFPLRQHDVSSRFQIPQKLYGREREIELLLAAFERVSQGACELMIVSGYAGIGKSALVQEIHKPITRQRGYFITGKFDQLQRDIPYASLLQAFGLLVRQLLTESEQEIAAWRERLLGALGPNGQVMIEVIPELELIIGPQPKVPDLPPTEAQNRFNHVLQNFIKVFAQPEHPLVIFLDDLQWADGASLKLIEVLMTGQESLYLFLIGAYRDNEVGEGHPSKLTLEVLKESRATVNHISLCPLARPYIVQLIADTLHHPPMEVEPLAELILAKTEGNPFFVNEFLKSLYTEKLLIFDFQQTGWRWNLRQIQAQRITDNVVELMAAKVRKLSEETQAILELAACIGNQFDLQTLAIVSEKTPQETAANLWAALVEGLILPLGDAYKLVELNVQGLVEELTVEYKFAHDQVQQATYFLIPESERQAVHHQIGQLLLRETSPAEREQKIFEIVNQLNLGRGLIQQQEEQEKLAELNLRAGQKAKAAAAFKPAFNYFHTGLTLLGDNSWGRRYDLTLGLFVESAEAAYLIADFDQMEQLIEVVLQEARTLLDKVKVYEIKIQAYIAQNKLHEAIKTALPVLKSLGVQFPEKPTTAHILRGLIETKWALTGKRVENLINLPAMSDPIKRATMQIMNTLISATYLTVPNLFPLIIFKQVSLSVKYGNTPESAKAYAMYGVILYEVTKNIESSYRFGQLALSLLERFDAREVKAKVFMGVYIFLNPWRAHFREILEPLREGYQSGLDAGDLEFAAYLLSACPVFAYHAGKNLVELEPELASVIEAIAQMKQARTGYVPRIYRQIALNLLGHSQTPSRLNGESYDDEQMPPLHHDANDITEHLYMSQLFLSYLFQEYAQAIEYAARAEERLEGFKGMALTVIFHFYDSLAQLAVFSASSSSTQKRILKKVTANQKKMKKWAKYAPMNFLHKFYLVEAEQAQVLGNDSQARDYYDQAIALAQENEYLNEEALAHELAAKFYLARGQNHVARHYLRDAHYTYLHWGATAKVKDLEARYPQFLAPARSSHELPTLTTPTTDTGETASSLLDLSSVLKASQAISGEIVLDKLLATLMKIVIENAGAQRGYLLLDKEGTWAIEAEGTVIENEAEVTALQSIPVGQVANLPHAIVNFVARTKESVVLNDAAGEGIFTQDPYIIQNQPKSILCSPLINQGKLNGILYLENNLTTGAFTWERQEVLNLLSGQAAISIENARLYTRQVELTHSASRFVPQEFLQFLGKDSIRQVNLGDQAQQDMTILVSDIRSFTTLSETMTPQENFDFVNAYLGQVSPIIRQHHGFIAKYMGDGMMAVFPRLTEDALSAAIETLKHVARYNVERQQQGQAPLQIGIGIHTGPVMLGTVGEAQRMQLDLLSDVVNVTVRLEGLSKLYGVALIVSAEALMRLEDPTQYHMRFLGKTPVKGRQETLSVFEVFDGDPAEIVTLKLQTKSDFEKALSLYYDWKFAEAKVLFEQALQSYPGDKAPQLYLKQMGQFTDYRVLFDEARVEGLMDR
jgi:predicted ATPase/class 3 adenylate cyclase